MSPSAPICQAQKKARYVQLRDVLCEAGQHRHNSPADQYSSDPEPCSDLVQQQIAGDFKDGVAEKENPKDQSELLACDSQLSVHRQCRKSNIDSVEKGNDEKQEDKGKNPDAHFLNGSGRDGHRTVVCLDIQDHLSVCVCHRSKRVSPVSLLEGVVKVAETVRLEATLVKQLADSFSLRARNALP